MTAEEHQEFMGIVVQALEEVVMPEFEKVRSEMAEFRQETHDRFDLMRAKLDDHTKILDEHGVQLVNIENKLDATIAVTDRHDERLTRVEKELKLPPLVGAPLK